MEIMRIAHFIIKHRISVIWTEYIDKTFDGFQEIDMDHGVKWMNKWKTKMHEAKLAAPQAKHSQDQ
ncbi:hypothetical protein An05g02180 [Aspergillus niger]|uniref:Uncharacterized protein n=2 Tax=Aspergillus niger TaxID=5061 RepID=A2QL13_ASPNC|nr:hypothetical protein An05g02180 [Aspergillus niger]CAK44879.1 hypothetical protein An05g02180 [Aspergillus niger]